MSSPLIALKQPIAPATTHSTAASELIQIVPQLLDSPQLESLRPRPTDRAGQCIYLPFHSSSREPSSSPTFQPHPALSHPAEATSVAHSSA